MDRKGALQPGQLKCDGFLRLAGLVVASGHVLGDNYTFAMAESALASYHRHCVAASRRSHYNAAGLVQALACMNT
jgi:hypothetical protein